MFHISPLNSDSPLKIHHHFVPVKMADVLAPQSNPALQELLNQRNYLLPYSAASINSSPATVQRNTLRKTSTDSLPSTISFLSLHDGGARALPPLPDASNSDGPEHRGSNAVSEETSLAYPHQPVQDSESCGSVIHYRSLHLHEPLLSSGSASDNLRLPGSVSTVEDTERIIEASLQNPQFIGDPEFPIAENPSTLR